MIGDHHGWTAGRITVLVRAVDGILGTYTVTPGPSLPLTATADELVTVIPRERIPGQQSAQHLARVTPAWPARD
jgi:hypothetical protein